MPCFLSSVELLSWCLLACNKLRPRQNGRHFSDDIFKCIFLNENIWIMINISLKFVPKGQINNIPALVQIMAWRRPGDKLLSEPRMVRSPTHICVTRPQWVKSSHSNPIEDWVQLDETYMWSIFKWIAMNSFKARVTVMIALVTCLIVHSTTWSPFY